MRLPPAWRITCRTGAEKGVGNPGRLSPGRNTRMKQDDPADAPANGAEKVPGTESRRVRGCVEAFVRLPPASCITC